MNNTNSEVNSEMSSGEPEFACTVICQTTTQKQVRKTDTNCTDRDSEEQTCFSCVVVRCGDVESAKQDVVSLSAIQSESYTWNTDRDSFELRMTNMGMMIVEGLGWRTVASGFGHWIDHWRGLV